MKDAQYRAERRTSQRFGTEIELTTRANKEMKGVISNVSRDGVFIKTRQLLPIHTQVEIKIHHVKRSIPMEGTVRWVDQSKGNKGMGIAFLPLSKRSQSAWNEIILSLIYDRYQKSKAV